MARIELTRVSKRYDGGAEVLTDLDATIEPGELAVLVGPSGCGKSTTLRLLAGLERPSAGVISLDGRCINDVPPQHRDVAMVFQSYALYPHMTVFENMAFGLALRKRPRAEIDERVRAAAAALDLEAVLSRKPAALSGGQRQRVALGRALVRQPRCFLFDEPLSNLDARLRASTRAEIKRLHQQSGTTSVYVTHDQEEAMTLADRLFVMHGGRLQQCGPPLQLYTRPANRFVAGFIGSPAMTFVSGQLVGVEGRIAFDEGTGRVPLPRGIQDRAAPFVGRPVVLGIRPQAVRLVDDADEALAMQVRLVEPLGADVDLHLATAKHPDVVARVPAGRIVRAGDTVFVRFDDAGVHLFEADAAGAAIA